MFRPKWLCALALVVAGLSATPANAQAPGSKLPPVVLDELTQTGAKSYDDFLGRAVLFEFFAHW